MEHEAVKHIGVVEHILRFLDQYQDFGILPSLLLTILEALIPIIPLFAIVMANAAAFGLWIGFLISWFGASAGSLLVFWITRKIGQRYFSKFLDRYEIIKTMIVWIENHGFGPLFLTFCFPFAPSAVINIVAGLSRMTFRQYALAVVSGKMVMIFTMSFIGHDLRAMFYKPFKLVLLILAIFLLWYVGKLIEKRLGLNKKKTIV